MLRQLPVLVLLGAAGGLTSWAQTAGAQAKTPQFPSHPDFKPTPEVPALPKGLMKMPRTNITRAKFPVVDFHLHGGSLRTAEDYQKMIKLMDATGIAVICNMDGGFGQAFDQNIKVGEPYRDRIIPFARSSSQVINNPGCSQNT